MKRRDGFTWVFLTGCLGPSAVAATSQNVEHAAVHALWFEAHSVLQDHAVDRSAEDNEASSRQRIEALYQGGDLIRALRLAEQEAPLRRDPYARYIALRIALDLDLPERAGEHLVRLQEALGADSGSIEPATLAWYQGAASELAAGVQERRAIQLAAKAARTRAQGVVGGVGLVIVLAWAVGAWLQRQRQSRSS